MNPNDPKFTPGKRPGTSVMRDSRGRNMVIGTPLNIEQAFRSARRNPLPPEVPAEPQEITLDEASGGYHNEVGFPPAAFPRVAGGKYMIVSYADREVQTVTDGGAMVWTKQFFYTDQDGQELSIWTSVCSANATSDLTFTAGSAIQEGNYKVFKCNHCHADVVTGTESNNTDENFTVDMGTPTLDYAFNRVIVAVGVSNALHEIPYEQAFPAVVSDEFNEVSDSGSHMELMLLGVHLGTAAASGYTFTWEISEPPIWVGLSFQLKHELAP